MPHLFPWKLQRIQRVTVFDRGNWQLQNTSFQHSYHHMLCIFSSNEQELACHNHKYMHQHLWATVIVDSAEMHHLPSHRGHFHCLFFINIQQAQMNVNWYHFFLHGGIWWPTFASYSLPHQHHFFQTALLLHQPQEKENVMQYWWEGANSTSIPPTSAPDVVEQYNKRIYIYIKQNITESITFGHF